MSRSWAHRPNDHLDEAIEQGVEDVLKLRRVLVLDCFRSGGRELERPQCSGVTSLLRQPPSHSS